MTNKPHRIADPLEREIEAAFRPGEFITDRACTSFVRQLDAVAATLAQRIETEPIRSVTLHETFIAGCYEKAEELDDSSGSFGDFVGKLFCGWITARQVAGANPEGTVTQLLAWMDDDPYGFGTCLRRDAARSLDGPGRVVFARQVRARFDAVTPEIDTTGTPQDRAGFPRRHWATVLRTIYFEQKNLAAYVALAEETGLAAEDHYAIATLLAARRKPAEALSWVERGIDLEKKPAYGSLAGYQLIRLRRNLLSKLGRSTEALASAWADYCKHPSKDAYEDVMQFVARAERATWHEKAMDLTANADLSAVIELLLETKETERLAGRVRQSEHATLEDLSHYWGEPAARKLERLYPDAAARLWRAQGMRIVNAGKSKYYQAALADFAHAKRSYERAALVHEWEEIVRQVRAAHRRKVSFMSEFEALVAGSRPIEPVTFLERARARWGRRTAL